MFTLRKRSQFASSGRLSNTQNDLSLTRRFIVVHPLRTTGAAHTERSISAPARRSRKQALMKLNITKAGASLALAGALLFAAPAVAQAYVPTGPGTVTQTITSDGPVPVAGFQPGTDVTFTLVGVGVTGANIATANLPVSSASVTKTADASGSATAVVTLPPTPWAPTPSQPPALAPTASPEPAQAPVVARPMGAPTPAAATPSRDRHEHRLDARHLGRRRSPRARRCGRHGRHQDASSQRKRVRHTLYEGPSSTKVGGGPSSFPRTLRTFQNGADFTRSRHPRGSRTPKLASST